MNKRSILVTGGEGFIGSALIETLLKRGWQVISLDLHKGDRLGDGPGLTRRVGDVRDGALVEDLVSQADRVVHLAAVVGVHSYLDRPAEVLDVNILGARTVLSACHQQKRPVVMASSSEVYGRTESVLDEHSDTRLGPTHNSRWSYAVSKLAGEHYARALGQQGLCYAIVRYFNVYGPLLDQPGEGRVLSKFIGCIREGKPLQLVADGLAVRTFCYIDDAVAATATIVEGLDMEAAYHGQAINIGNQDPCSIRELAERVIALSGHEQGTQEVSGVEHFGAGFDEIPVRVPDTRLLTELVGFQPRVDLDEGLRRTLAHWGLLRDGLQDPPGPAPVPFVRPCFEGQGAAMTAYADILRTGLATNNGLRLREFEGALAKYLDVPDVVVVGSGYAALWIAGQCLGLRGKVVMPSYTYIATASAFVNQGLTPIFCDVDSDTYTLCPKALEELLDQHRDVSAVVAVNVFGVPPDLAGLRALTETRGISLVYDNAHGFGSELHGSRLPHEPRLQTFSFHATKLLPAVEGGMLVASDGQLLAEARRLRNHGLAPDLFASGPGMNAKLDELRAATGLANLEHMDGILTRRREYGQVLRQQLLATDVFQPQSIPPGVQSNFQNLGVRYRGTSLASIEEVAARLLTLGVQARRYFHPPLHLMEGFVSNGSLPRTEEVWQSLLCWPMHSRMSVSTLDRIGRAIDGF